jgi:hypothetical protein
MGSGAFIRGICRSGGSIFIRDYQLIPKYSKAGEREIVCTHDER